MECVHDWLILEQIDKENIKLKCFRCEEIAVFIKSQVSYRIERSEENENIQDTFINIKPY